MASTVKVAPHQVGGPAPHSPVSSNHGIALAPIAANNAPHLSRYQRSRILLERAQQAAQQAIAARAEQWVSGSLVL